MATTLYLPGSGTPPLGSLPVDTNWELTNGLVRLPCKTTKQNTALATSTRTWPATSTQQWCWWQFQSEQLLNAYDWTTADAVSMVIGKCAETTTSGDTHLAYVVKVVSADGSVIRGVIGLYHATSSEYPLVASAATRIHNARVAGATNFSSQPGDRIIIEIGLHGVTPAAQNIQMRIGDPSATGDFALTAGLTTDLCPWVRLSKDVVFGIPPVSASILEPASAAAVISAIALLLAGVAEPGIASDIINANVSSPVSQIIESAVADATVDATIIFHASVNEGTTASDIKSSYSVIPAVITENEQATEYSGAIKTTQGTVIESGAASESRSGVLITSGIVAESGSLLDIKSAKQDALAGIIESGIASESISAGFQSLADISEAGSASEILNAIKAINAGIIEASQVLEIPGAQFIAKAQQDEYGEAADILGSVKTAGAVIIETLTADDIFEAFIITTSAISELLNIIDFYSAGIVITAAVIEKTLLPVLLTQNYQYKQWTGTEWKEVNILILYKKTT